MFGCMPRRAPHRPPAAPYMLALRYTSLLMQFTALHPLCPLPLPILLLQREVITQRDSSSLPLGLCAMVTIQCTSWTIYGWLREDWSTFANNAVGVFLGSIQLALIFSCPNKRRAAAAATKGASSMTLRCDLSVVASLPSASWSCLALPPLCSLAPAHAAPLHFFHRHAADATAAAVKAAALGDIGATAPSVSPGTPSKGSAGSGRGDELGSPAHLVGSPAPLLPPPASVYGSSSGNSRLASASSGSSSSAAAPGSLLKVAAAAAGGGAPLAAVTGTVDHADGAAAVAAGVLQGGAALVRPPSGGLSTAAPGSGAHSPSQSKSTSVAVSAGVYHRNGSDHRVV